MLNKLKADVCLQVDAEGAGALVVPHALADMGHGLCGIHICLLLSWEVAQFNPKPNSCPQVFTANTALLFEAEAITKEVGGIISSHASVLFLFNLQVQIGGAVGLCGHGGSSCSGHTVYGENNQRIKYCLSLLLTYKKQSFVSPSSVATGFLLLCGNTLSNYFLFDKVTTFQSICFQVDFLSFFRLVGFYLNLL